MQYVERATVAPKGWLQSSLALHLVVEDTRRGLRVKFEKMEERSSRRVRDLVTQLAVEGLSENEIGRARISMMARSDLLHARAGYRSARPVTPTLKDLACNARPVHTVGSFTSVWRHVHDFRCTLLQQTFGRMVGVGRDGPTGEI